MVDVPPAVRSALSDLARLWPALFGARCTPLSRSIHERILEATGGASDGDALRDALHVHVTRPSYLRSMMVGAARVDLEGLTVGYVTSVEAEAAAQLLAVIRKRDRDGWHRIERDRIRDLKRSRARRARAM